jgi:putative dimethyl sulfoxide reductase chaperone
MTGAANIRAAKERAQVYDLLATIFRRPLDAAQIKALGQPDMLTALAAVGMDSAAELDGANPADLREALAIDFTQIFHNPETKFMPFEGLMLSRDTELLGGRARAVAQFMADVGYRVAPESGEVADHIAIELSFLADLASREADALEAGDDVLATRARQIQADFLDRHIGRWVDRFAKRVHSHSDTAFYPAMARMAAEFVASERGTLPATTSEDA